MRRLVVLAKPPQRGRAKTRLASDIGEGRAARLARAMLYDTWADTATRADASTEVRLAVSDEVVAYPRLVPEPTTQRQVEGDLGRRMAALAAAGCADGRDVLLLGTDSPGLDPGLHERALAALADHDVVLGPVADGGFWCLGVSARAAARADDRWLDGLDWTRDDTRVQVETRARARGLSVALAPDGHDVDRVDDLPGLTARLARHPGRAPATAAALAAPGDDARWVSVVVTTRNEGRALDRCLAAVALQPGPHEIIVADGGSHDGSTERAAAAGHPVVDAPPGRGPQLAAGAALATADRLLFLHVDVALPDGALDRVRETLARPGVESGAFVTRTERDPALPNPLGPLLRLADLRSRFTSHPYGDQAMFVSRRAYDAVGGFRPLPIMEDYDLAVRLARRAPIARVRDAVSVSGRRMQRRPLRTLLLMRIIPPLYRLGVDPARLARLYRGS